MSDVNSSSVDVTAESKSVDVNDLQDITNEQFDKFFETGGDLGNAETSNDKESEKEPNVVANSGNDNKEKNKPSEQTY